jgi:UDP-GlcNAc:undecaprenyl-phosphate GlcNAc-1-phosphate transferase
MAGGLAIFASAGIALLFTLSAFVSLREHRSYNGQLILGLFVASILICCVGLVDDFGKLRGRYKLIGQLIAVGIVILFGVQIHTIHLFGWRVELRFLALPFTTFVLLGAINSLNLLDGMDGLLSSVGSIICLAFGAMALLSGKVMPACIAFTLAASLLAFLYYNFPPASIFLGDSGSMLIGLTVGVLAIQTSLKGPATIALAAPTALLIIPIFDTTAAILRRKLTGRSIYSTDRGHLHHCLLRQGYTSGHVLLVVSCCCLVTVVGALASLVLKNELVAVLSALVVVSMLILTRLFGYAELCLVFQRVQDLMPPLLPRRQESRARESEVRLQGSVDWRELWMRITASAPVLNLRRVRFDVNAPAIHEGYHARWDLAATDSDEAELWQAAIPLSVYGRCIGQVEVFGYRDDEPVWRKIATLARLVEGFESTASLLTERSWQAVVTSDTPAPIRRREEQVPLA